MKKVKLHIKMDFVIIMTRHVNSRKTDHYWLRSYSKIRTYYPEEPIIIIDDNSTFTPTDMKLYNCEIIRSEFPGAGELLAYYYFKRTSYKRMLYIHDSVFLNSRLNDDIDQKVIFLWNFELRWEPKNLMDIIDSSELNFKDEIKEFYYAKNWLGCFGCMSIIDREFLEFLDEKYNFLSLVNIVRERKKRFLIERLISVLCYIELGNVNSLFGLIHDFLPWGLTYDEYLRKNKNSLPIWKIWSGR